MAIAKKRKKFFDVEIPLIQKTTQLFGYDEEELAKRYIKYDLTRLLRGKNAILTLKVVLEGENLTTIPKELYLPPSYTKRLVRKSTSYIEDSIKIACRDSHLLIKPLLVTRRIVPNRVKKALRNKMREELTSYIQSKTYEDIFQELLRNQIQKELSSKLKKIYPLSLCEIRWIKVLKTE